MFVLHSKKSRNMNMMLHVLESVNRRQVKRHGNTANDAFVLEDEKDRSAAMTLQRGHLPSFLCIHIVLEELFVTLLQFSEAQLSEGLDFGPLQHLDLAFFLLLAAGQFL